MAPSGFVVAFEGFDGFEILLFRPLPASIGLFLGDFGARGVSFGSAPPTDGVSRVDDIVGEADGADRGCHWEKVPRGTMGAFQH